MERIPREQPPSTSLLQMYRVPFTDLIDFYMCTGGSTYGSLRYRKPAAWRAATARDDHSASY